MTRIDPPRPAMAAPRPLRPVSSTPSTLPRDPQRVQNEVNATRRRLERQAAELMFELKPTSLLRTQLGGHSRAGTPEIGMHMFSKLKKHPVLVSGLVTTLTSLLLAGDEARPGRSLRQRLVGLIGGSDATERDRRLRDEHGRFISRDAATDPEGVPGESLITQAGERVAAVAGEGVEKIKDTAGRTTETVTQTVKDHPVLIGAAAIGAGLLIGALIPRTRREMARLGAAAADDLKERGQAALEAVKDQLDVDGNPVIERARSVGSAAAGGARQALTGAAVQAVAERVSGKPATPLGQQVRRAAADAGVAAREAGLEASRDAGLHPEQLKETAKAAESAATGR